MRFCVFCGSSPGHDPSYLAAARDLGAALAREGIGLVYGGASVGLMGAVADAVMTGGGEVVGVMPQSLVDKEIAHKGLADLRIVGSMHERKALMAELADGFVALPGAWAPSRSCSRSGPGPSSAITANPAPSSTSAASTTSSRDSSTTW
jgi:uncharacterized protein (TIGR00730 family)